MHIPFTRMLHGSHRPDLQMAAKMLARDRIVAIPTDTVYGLGACASSKQAVEALYQLKGRPRQKAMILLVGRPEDALPFWCAETPTQRQRIELARDLMERFWPGALTLIAEKSDRVPAWITADGPTVGLRCPDHSATRQIIEILGEPLAAPSANLSGQESPTGPGAVLATFVGRIDAVVDGGRCHRQGESTVVDLSGHTPRILRQGSIKTEELAPWLQEAHPRG